jgi:hypothetical protein
MTLERLRVTIGRTSICDAVGLIPVGRWRLDFSLHAPIVTLVYKPIDAEFRPTPDDVDPMARDKRIAAHRYPQEREQYPIGCRGRYWSFRHEQLGAAKTAVFASPRRQTLDSPK